VVATLSSAAVTAKTTYTLGGRCIQNNASPDAKCEVSAQ
jgi:hypothetical protein